MRQLSNDEKDELVCFFISRYSHELAEKLNDLLKTHPFGHSFQITGVFYAAKEQEQVFLSIDGIRIDYAELVKASGTQNFWLSLGAGFLGNGMENIVLGQLRQPKRNVQLLSLLHEKMEEIGIEAEVETLTLTKVKGSRTNGNVRNDQLLIPVELEEVLLNALAGYLKQVHITDGSMK